MSKKKPLSQGQLRRMRANQTKRLKRGDDDTQQAELQDNLLGPEQAGVVISRFGQHADIETADGTVSRCNIRRAVTSLVTGDKVVVRLATEVQSGSSIGGIVIAVHPRKSSLTRPDLYDGVKGIDVIPCFYKLDETNREEIETALTRYQNIGYQVFRVSSHTGEGVEDLKELLNNSVSVFAGQSGVGKSSLINALMPDAELLIGDVSGNSGLGQHTTTTAKLLHFVSGGDLIDSPGVREFALWHLDAIRVGWCFVEFRDFLGSCKFRDCKHGDDPGCALQQALADGKITQDRFSNYQRIIASLDEQRHARHFRAIDE